MKNLLKNWKTSLFGLLTAVGIIAYKVIAKQPITSEDIAIAGAAIGIGGSAKDGNVTGGTIKQ